jgi:NodT family efflux transporter outer membrane factor (OMF) lipoprotein
MSTGFRLWIWARGFIRIIIISGFTLLIACKVGPDYVRPKAVTPGAYKEMAGWKVAQPQDEVPHGAWWKLFHDPQLNAFEEQVNISNQNVLAAEAQFRQALALIQVARASYFPTLTAGASYTRSLLSSNGPAGGTAASSPHPFSDLVLPFDFSWELDIWGRVRRTVEANRASAQASAADLEGMRLSSQGTLAQTYFQLHALDSEKQLLEATVIAYQKDLDLTKNRYASGVASREDVLLAETQLKTTQAQAIDVGVQRAQMEHAIALLVGKPPSDFSISIEPLVAVPPSIPVGVPSELLERRPDIAAAERSVAAANAQIGVAVAAFYPTVTLNASGGLEAKNFSNWFAWPSRFWSVGPAITETVFEGGLRRAVTDQARAVYDQNVANYRQTVLTGFQGVEDNLAALRILEQEAQVQEEAVKAAAQSLTVTTNQYKAGIVSYLNVIVAQAILLNNEQTAISILGRRMVASVLLIEALGGGWDASALLSPPDSSSCGHTSR